MYRLCNVNNSFCTIIFLCLPHIITLMFRFILAINIIIDALGSVDDLNNATHSVKFDLRNLQLL